MKYDMAALRAVQKLDDELMAFLAEVYGKEGTVRAVPSITNRNSCNVMSYILDRGTASDLLYANESFGGLQLIHSLKHSVLVFLVLAHIPA
jgi:hypothetical protein